MNDIKRFEKSPYIIYLSDGSQVSGTSRILPVKNRAMQSVVFMQGRPVLDSEINLVQGIFNYKFHEFADMIQASGWRDHAPYGLDSIDASYAYFAPFVFMFKGNLITFDDGNGRVMVNLGPKIQQPSRVDTIVAYFYMEEVGAPGENTPLRESLKLYGNLNGATATNDLIDPALPDKLPTTRRVQLSYRVAALAGEQYVSAPSINTDGQIVENYRFDPDMDGMYRAGDGTIESAERLGSVDGYVYMLPLFRVIRYSGDTGIRGDRLMNLVPRMSLRDSIKSDKVIVAPNGQLAFSGGNIDELVSHIASIISNNQQINANGLQSLIDGQNAINTKLQEFYDYYRSQE